MDELDADSCGKSWTAARGRRNAQSVPMCSCCPTEPAGIGAADRLAPLIGRAFRCSYIMAMRMREDMFAEGGGEKLEELVRATRAVQDEHTGASGG